LGGGAVGRKRGLGGQPVDGLLFVDGQRRIRKVTQRAAELLGLSESESVGLLLDDVVTDLPSSGHLGSLKTTVRRADGLRIPVIVEDLFLDGAWAVVIHDLRGELDESLVRFGSMAAVGEMTCSMAHEANNSLNAVIGCAEFLIADFGDFPLPAGQPARRWPAYADLIRKGATRCSEVISRVHQFARQGHTEKETLDLRTVFDWVAPMLSDVATRRGARLESTLGSSLMTQGRKSALGVLITNLGLQGIASVKAPGKVVFRESSDVDQVVISVTYPGLELPPGRVGHWLPDGVCTDEATKLRLLTSESIARDHGGYLEVHHIGDRETEISAVLPAQESSA
jgi:signal transduction histidine kinase